MKSSLKNFFTKHAWLLSPVAFTFGFFVDLFTLNRIDQRFDLGILLAHLLLVTFWICIWHLGQSKRSFWKKRKKFSNWAYRISPVAMQFSFGALASGFVIFYTKSSSLFISWPFLIFIYVFFLGNESFRRFYKGVVFQVGVFYFSVFTFLIFLIPLLLSRIGTDVFLAAGFLSLVFIGFFLWLLRFWFRSISSLDYKRLWLSVLLICAGVNLLYFEKIIPAIPLSLKADGIYYSIERTAEGYKVTEENSPLWNKIWPIETVRKPENNRLYYFSAIFAPQKFDLAVFHDWQKYDEDRQQWVTIFSESLKIKGGRDGGFRGYTFMNNPDYGKWRIMVRTENGQIVGQKNFNLVSLEEMKSYLILRTKTL